MQSLQSFIVPYMNFNGNCREAMEFYHSILGGKLTMQTFEEANTGMPIPEGHGDKIMHASLENERLSLMASDGMPGKEVVFGDSVSLSIVGQDEEQLTSWFEKLADGGEITMKLEKQFWGDMFGMLKDKFGINWMVNVSASGQGYI